VCRYCCKTIFCTAFKQLGFGLLASGFNGQNQALFAPQTGGTIKKHIAFKIFYKLMYIGKLHKQIIGAKAAKTP
jgi:hypothetical protein